MKNRWLLLFLGCGLLAGCGDRSEITRYQAPKVETTLATAGKDRMLAAMAIHDGTAWFFKLTGPDEPVQQHAGSFEALVRSLSFENERPNWKLPEGWKQEAGSAMRFATIRVPAERRTLELTVIPLPVSGDDLDSYVHSNVNRWRGQLQLPELTADEIDRQAKRFEVGGDPVIYVNMAGKLSGGAMGSGGPGQAPFAPFAGGQGLETESVRGQETRAQPGVRGQETRAQPGVRGQETRARPPESSDSDLKYELPKGWTPSQGNAISRAAFQAVDGDKRVEITVSTAGGDLLQNVNRWRDQVQLPHFSQAELEQAKKPIELAGGTAGEYVVLAGEQETILGVVAVKSGRTWFIELRGDSTLAGREQPNFESFVRSLQLP